MNAQRFLNKLLIAGGLSFALGAGAPVAAQTDTMAGADPCQGQTNCTYSKPLLAKITGVTAATKNNSHLVTVRVTFQNRGDAPLILNYKERTGEMIDELGERYIVDWRHDDAVQGMPVSTRKSASSVFSLAPGESRTASFRYQRYVGRNVPPGTVFQPSLTIEQYKLQSADRLQLERDYLLSFGAASAGPLSAQGGDELKKVVEGLGKLFKKQ